MSFVNQYPDYGFGYAWDNGGVWEPWYANTDEGSIPKHLIPLSRWMARFLRHEAKIAEDGWFKLEDLMANTYMHKHSLNDVRVVVKESFSGTRPRFEVKEPYIRATHKHSVRRSGEEKRPPRQQARTPQGTTTDVDKDSTMDNGQEHSTWSWWIKKEPTDEGSGKGPRGAPWASNGSSAGLRVKQEDDGEQSGAKRKSSASASRSPSQSQSKRKRPAWTWNWKDGERMQKWLAWALKSGYKDLGLQREDSQWLPVDDLAKAMKKYHADYGVSTAEDLRSMLRETDWVGRFEVKDGQLRKVPRDERHAGGPVKADRRQVKAENMDDDNTGHSGGGNANGSMIGSSYSSFGVQNSAVATGPRLGVVMPPGPPGEHWTPYDDRGTSWWMYEGPLGKWWCVNEGDPLMRYDGSPEIDFAEL